MQAADRMPENVTPDMAVDMARDVDTEQTDSEPLANAEQALNADNNDYVARCMGSGTAPETVDGNRVGTEVDMEEVRSVQSSEHHVLAAAESRPWVARIAFVGLSDTCACAALDRSLDSLRIGPVGSLAGKASLFARTVCHQSHHVPDKVVLSSPSLLGVSLKGQERALGDVLPRRMWLVCGVEAEAQKVRHHFSHFKLALTDQDVLINPAVECDLIVTVQS